MKKINTLAEHNSLDQVYIEKVDQKIWFKSGSETWCYDILDLSAEGQRRKKAATASPEIITAPMPGKITKVFSKKGDSVNPGQALLVMEAMKMEYTLKSDLKTQIEDVLCQVGDQVQVGAVLVRLARQES